MGLLGRFAIRKHRTNLPSPHEAKANLPANCPADESCTFTASGMALVARCNKASRPSHFQAQRFVRSLEVGAMYQL